MVSLVLLEVRLGVVERDLELQRIDAEQHLPRF